MLFWIICCSFEEPWHLLGTLLTTDSNSMAENTLIKVKLPGELWRTQHLLNYYVKISKINSEFWAPWVFFFIFYLKRNLLGFSFSGIQNYNG